MTGRDGRGRLRGDWSTATSGFDGAATGYEAAADLAAVNARILELAAAQSRDIEERLETVGVRVAKGWGG